MKNYLKIYLLLFGFILVCQLNCSAQGESGGDRKKKPNNTNTEVKTVKDNTSTVPKMEDWNWGTYKIKFKVPTDFEVKQNDDNTFVAENGKINLSIYPRKEQLTNQGMSDALAKWAKDNRVASEGAPNQFKSGLNGFIGYYIDGTVDDYPTSVLVLKNPSHPEFTHYIWLSYAGELLDTAVEILKSFKPQE